MIGLRDFAMGASPVPAGMRSAGLTQPRTPMGSLGVNTPARRTPKFDASAQSRLRARAREALSTIISEAVERYDIPVEEAEKISFEGALSSAAGKKFVDEKVNKANTDSNIVDAIREVWAAINTSEVVGTVEGYTLRRIMLAVVGAPPVGFTVARRFLGGQLKDASWKEAKARRANALANGDFTQFTGKRKRRSDRFDESCPLLLACVGESIDENTQPSPCATRTLHDWTPGNHSRSQEDNSIVCLYEDKCKTANEKYVLGTRDDLYRVALSDVQVQHAAGRVEKGYISRAAFDKLVPFNVVEQSRRTCLCVHCLKAKLATTAVCRMWPSLHACSSGGSCSCSCDFCDGGKCADFLPYTCSKAVHSMHDLSDKLLCPPEVLYKASDGKDVVAHKSVCVSGFCLECKARQKLFFDCPMHRGDGTGVALHASPDGTSTPGPSQGPPATVRWRMFTAVDDNGRPTTPGSASRSGDDHGGEDDDWTPTNGQARRKKQAVVWKEGSVRDFFDELKAIFKRYIWHYRQYKQQARAFKEHVANLSPGEVVLVADFQEQLGMGSQDEVQSLHWSHESVVIFPVPIYFRWGGRVWSYSFQVMSDDRAQDSAWVQHVMTKLLSDEIPALLRKLGEPPMTDAIVFTDNCAKQFKCRYHFHFVSDSGIKARDAAGRKTAEELRLEWHYFGSCHGKSSSDSEGSVTKRAAQDNVTNMSWAPTTPRQLFELCAKDLGFQFVEPTPDERHQFYQNKADGRGTLQVLVTKVSCGRDRAEERKTFLVKKMMNTLCGRKYIFVDNGDVTAEFRKSVYSKTHEIALKGCQRISRTAMSSTPGVILAWTLSCCCPPCMNGAPEMCSLISNGITGPPSEWSRSRRPTDQTSEKEKELEGMFRLVEKSLPYGSVALMRVSPDEYNGEEVVPFVVGRKAVSAWTSRLASDGMFSPGDMVIWIHDIEQVADRPGEYNLLRVLPNQESRAIPLKCIAGLGQGSAGYMDEVSFDDSEGELTTRFRLRRDAVKTARSNLALMSLNPKLAFAGFSPVPFSENDEDRAFVEEAKFEVGTVFSRAFTAPTQGRFREWSGKQKLDGKVLEQATFPTERRHYYRLEWRADKDTPALALAPEVVDEGYLELALQGHY